MASIMRQGVNYTRGGSSTLTDLTDTAIESPADGQLLVYDGTEWVNGNVAGVNVQPVIYSDEEREVGVWRDGKPLYQKTIPYGSVSGSSASLSLGIANVEHIALVSSGSSINGVFTIPYVHSQQSLDIGGFFDISASDTTFEMRIGSSSVGNVSSVVITVQYTKTTDTAGSGTWTPSGILAHHYSTTEQEVGIDENGDTIYEKVLSFTNTTINSYVQVDVSALDIGNLLYVDGQYTRLASGMRFFYRFGGYESSTYYSAIRYNATNKTLDYYIVLSSGEATDYQRIVLQYTKSS